MESLEGLRRNSDILALRLALTGAGPADPDIRRYFVHLVRMVDVAVEEYETARAFHQVGQEPLDEERSEGMLRAIDHLELCVITTTRALNALDALARERNAPPVPRQLRRRLAASSSGFRDVRDIVVHLEEG